ncbi:receptor-type tyrosine-protein phosphatase beta [Plakobranchus ocellatus]|uniref:protein-tyrosine-phosphatase n=1 Tax=Plakobranchus ocellatus TaxID=259542 RepID=A0AAV4AQ95_9GAST|nr:receptor-type tyrosine-protein phosphatase beta [Plakobranchus ocellatus]
MASYEGFTIFEASSLHCILTWLLSPGLVIDFKVELDENDAQKIAISFRCPRITERNGNLLKYVVRKQWKQSMREQEETTEITHNENCFFSTTNFGPSLLEGIEYSFQVQAINDYSDGMFNGAIKRLIEPKGSSDGAPIGAIIGGIIAVIVIVLLVLGALYFLRRRKIPRAQRRNSDIVDPGPSVRKERPINIRRFGEALATYHKDANLCFQDDFEDIKKLSSDLKHASDEAKREENRVKNRYVNILPYDFSRVKLSILSDEHETMDFINANYIPGFNSVREYIATQGPMYCTIPDFWRMMWEQNSKIIVMLSDLQEAGKRKVDLYWPENLNEPINYGNIVVEMTNFSQLNKYTIRNFKISWGENEPRRVTHFFLAGWMDFSANLKYSDVLEFAKLVRQEATPANSGPIVVHCSAGVGRTGTFIALDYFMQHLDRYGLDFEIDIFSYVMRMRYHRPSMVQAETQYVFIYDALYEVIKQKLKEEEERMYDNNVRPGSNVYVNVPLPSEEESIYLNMNGQSNSDNSHVYENQAFEPESGIEDDKPTKGEKTPTTAL